MTQSLETCAELLDQSEDYQVLRRLTAIKQFNPSPEPFAEIIKSVLSIQKPLDSIPKTVKF